MPFNISLRKQKSSEQECFQRWRKNENAENKWYISAWSKTIVPRKLQSLSTCLLGNQSQRRVLDKKPHTSRNTGTNLNMNTRRETNNGEYLARKGKSLPNQTHVRGVTWWTRQDGGTSAGAWLRIWRTEAERTTIVSESLPAERLRQPVTLGARLNVLECERGTGRQSSCAGKQNWEYSTVCNVIQIFGCLCD